MIGILAGMGPRSTAPFIDMIVTECQLQYGAKLDEEFPPMMIHSLPAPFYMDRPLDDDALTACIQKGLQRLMHDDIDFVAMPCNTAHMYYPDLAAAIDTPLLNMIDVAADALPPGTSRVALLATRQTLGASMYQERLMARGIEPLHQESWQRQVDDLIRVAKASTDPAAARDAWRSLMDDVRASGADGALLACTDLNAVGGVDGSEVAVFDATRMLAASTVRRWKALQPAGEEVR